ncbi:putative uncharacterized protein DDB_G0289963 [Eutrema salsugineum]|uniref:putative uncharacterized protein DDB_G0289963 n=1 Tax=Eutrema salsugineum TaxID=72664 RepID=UPI000CED43C8|nr:putative uncharacterized protein DDB_G0289963 [Eutrema salsugineum]
MVSNTPDDNNNNNNNNNNNDNSAEKDAPPSGTTTATTETQEEMRNIMATLMKKIDEQDKRNEAIMERLDAMTAERRHPTWRAGISDPTDGVRRRFDFSTPAGALGSGTRNPMAPPMFRPLSKQTPAATRITMTELPLLRQNSRQRADDAIDVDAQQNDGTRNLQQNGSAQRISQEKLASALNGIRTDEVTDPDRDDNPTEEEENLQWVKQAEREDEPKREDQERLRQSKRMTRAQTLEIEELRASMARTVAEIRAMKSQVHNATSVAPEIDQMLEKTQRTPFTVRITEARISEPRKVRIPFYEGTTDPKAHITAFG